MCQAVSRVQINEANAQFLVSQSQNLSSFMASVEDSLARFQDLMLEFEQKRDEERGSIRASMLEVLRSEGVLPPPAGAQASQNDMGELQQEFTELQMQFKQQKLDQEAHELSVVSHRLRIAMCPSALCGSILHLSTSPSFCRC